MPRRSTSLCSTVEDLDIPPHQPGPNFTLPTFLFQLGVPGSGRLFPRKRVPESQLSPYPPTGDFYLKGSRLPIREGLRPFLLWGLHSFYPFLFLFTNLLLSSPLSLISFKTHSLSQREHAKWLSPVRSRETYPISHLRWHSFPLTHTT